VRGWGSRGDVPLPSSWEFGKRCSKLPSGVRGEDAPAADFADYDRPPYGIGQAIIFLPCGFFYLLSSSVFFFPRLISAVADWMSAILAHMVWP